MLSPEDMEKAKLVQLGLQQFEAMHLPIRDPDQPKDEGEIICSTCDEDFPCQRMLLFMLLQGISSLSSMIPSGNMAGIMARFGGGKS